MTVTIYHNPRCTKSRKTLQLLQDKGIEHEVIEYLKTPPSVATMTSILEKLGMHPRDFIRKKEAEYKEAALDNPGLSEAQLIEGIVKNPKLFERPVVLANGKAAIGRPPENILEIL